MSDDEILERVRSHIGAGELQDALDLCLPLANEGHAEALYLLAVISHHGGLAEQALNLFREAAKLLPGRADVNYNFGVFLREAGEIDGAIEQWMQAAKANPNHWQASFNLGLALSDTGRDGEAIKAYEQCLEAAPGNIDALYNLANACYRTGLWERALKAYESVLAVRPDHPGALSNLGLTLTRCGLDDRAVAVGRAAVQRSPEDVHAHVNLGHALMAAGDWLAGFDELEWRWKAQRRPAGLDDVPDWDGGDLDGGHLILFGEQGHGDVIQFARFAKMARERANAGRITVLCHDALKAVIGSIDGIDAVLGLDATPADADACWPLMSLPVHLWSAESVVMPTPPYVPVPPPRALDAQGLKVGLAWRGNPEHDNDANRSCPLAALLPVLGLSGVEFYALQWPGMTDEEAAMIKGGGNVHDAGRTYDDFAGAAEIVAGLDVMISVDSAIAHLAGALGKDTWVMLPRVSEWRWRGPQGFSPWYPAARLFQQEADEDDWAGVAERLRLVLEDMIRGKA